MEENSEKRQSKGLFKGSKITKGKKLLSMIALCLLAVVVFAFSGCISQLEGHVQIKEYGITGLVDRDAWSKWVPGGCKPEEEEIFINFTADNEFGSEIHVGYYMLNEWNEVKDKNGNILSETTPTVTDYRSEYISISSDYIQKTDNGYSVKFSGLHKGQYAIRITGVKGTEEEVAAFNRYQRQINAYVVAYEQYKLDLVQYEKDLSAYWDGTLAQMPTHPTEPTKPIKPESVAKLEGNNVEVVVRIGGYKDCFDETGKLIPNDYPVEAA